MTGGRDDNDIDDETLLATLIGGPIPASQATEWNASWPMPGDYDARYLWCHVLKSKSSGQRWLCGGTKDGNYPGLIRAGHVFFIRRVK